jgi:hypothetical protein
MPSKYAMLTVDTEALQKRAADNHVNKLIWGSHDKGTAGIREIVEIGYEFKSKFIFFVDVCGCYSQFDEIENVIRFLNSKEQDVQLHAHPEYLTEDFWKKNGFKYRPRFLNEYNLEKATFVIKYFSKFISNITNKKISAFRAGSFRWNEHTIEALKENNITFSFNNSMKAFYEKKCTYSLKNNNPFQWSNGIIEIPCTEYQLFPFIKKDLWWRFSFPLQGWLSNSYIRLLKPYTKNNNNLLVLLLHSWSLLYWDRNNHAIYKDDKRLESLRKLIKTLSKDYEIITTIELLDLIKQGKINIHQYTDLSLENL